MLLRIVFDPLDGSVDGVALRAGIVRLELDSRGILTLALPDAGSVFTGAGWVVRMRLRRFLLGAGWTQTIVQILHQIVVVIRRIRSVAGRSVIIPALNLHTAAGRQRRSGMPASASAVLRMHTHHQRQPGSELRHARSGRKHRHRRVQVHSGRNAEERMRLGRPTVVRRDLPPEVRRVQLGIGIGRVAVPTPPGTEHHVASIHRALVHLPQVHRRKVDL